jgi:hypothetical protein
MEYGPRGPRQLRNGQFSPAARPFRSAFIGVGEQCLRPTGDLAQVGIACLAIRPAWIAAAPKPSRCGQRSLGGFEPRWASRGGPDKCPQRIVPAMRKCLPPRSSRTASTSTSPGCKAARACPLFARSGRPFDRRTTEPVNPYSPRDRSQGALGGDCAMGPAAARQVG